jgi:hypothetical protein
MGAVRVKTLSSNGNRSARRWATALLTAGILTAGVAGCGSGDDEEADSLAKMTSTIDYDDGSIETPARQLTLTWDEETTIGYANSIASSQCMGKKGIEYSPYDRRDEISEKAYTDIGVWSRTLAAKYGYDPIPDTEAKDDVASEQLSEDDVAALRDCANNDQSVKQFADIENEFANQIQPALVDNVVINDEARDKIRQSWVECMESKGLKIDEEEFIPSGVSTMSEEEEIKTALKDVDCKESTKFVDAWADNLWDEQKQYVTKHASEFQEFRSRAVPVLENARQVIKSYEG